MSTFSFYKEFDDGHSCPFDLSNPQSKIITNTFPVAISIFSKEQKISLVDKDQIDDTHVRAYFVKKKFLGKEIESIYYISVVD